MQIAPSPAEMIATYNKMAEEIHSLGEYKKEVPENETNGQLSLLRETLDGERFMFVIDLHKMRIEHASGISRWLGYTDNNFSLLDYLKIIHPAHAAIHRITSVQGIRGLMEGRYDIEFMKHRYITNIALRHHDGRYLLCKRLASVFQYYKKDGKKHLLEYINEFTIVGEYNDEPYITRSGNKDAVEQDWEMATLKMIQKTFEEKNHFSSRELDILRKYAYNPGITVPEIARALNIEPSTVLTLSKRILNKAELLFSIRAANTKEVAIGLRKQGLL